MAFNFRINEGGSAPFFLFTQSHSIFFFFHGKSWSSWTLDTTELSCQSGIIASGDLSMCGCGRKLANLNNNEDLQTDSSNPEVDSLGEQTPRYSKRPSCGRSPTGSRRPSFGLATSNEDEILLDVDVDALREPTSPSRSHGKRGSSSAKGNPGYTGAPDGLHMLSDNVYKGPNNQFDPRFGPRSIATCGSQHSRQTSKGSVNNHDVAFHTASKSATPHDQAAHRENHVARTGVVRGTSRKAASLQPETPSHRSSSAPSGHMRDRRFGPGSLVSGIGQKPKNEYYVYDKVSGA
jgi:hypothetical protein